MLGNSITNGANWAEIFNNPQVLNRGISGDNTFGVLHRLHQITAVKPAKVFIMIGINDLAKKTPVEVILSNVRKIVNRIKKDTPETQIFLQSILPTNNLFDDFKKHQNKDKDIKAVNTGLEELARDVNVSFIDLYPHFLDSAGRLSADYTNDGLHLTGSGYMLWADLIRDLIEN
jgi:lysophospholipase L1-like esterase